VKTYRIPFGVRGREVTIADGGEVPDGAELIGDAAPPVEGRVAIVNQDTGAIEWVLNPPADAVRAVAGVNVWG
jgi:hypothetical protein